MRTVLAALVLSILGSSAAYADGEIVALQKQVIDLQKQVITLKENASSPLYSISFTGEKGMEECETLVALLHSLTREQKFSFDIFCKRYEYGTGAHLFGKVTVLR